MVLCLGVAQDAVVIEKTSIIVRTFNVNVSFQVKMGSRRLKRFSNVGYLAIFLSCFILAKGKKTNSRLFFSFDDLALIQP